MNGIKGYVIVGLISILLSVGITWGLIAPTMSALQVKADKISTLEVRVESLNTLIGQNNREQLAKIEANNPAINKATADNTQQDIRITALERQFSNLEYTLGQKITSEVTTQVASNIASNNKAVSDSVTAITAGQSDRIAALETKVSSLEGQVATLQTYPNYPYYRDGGYPGYPYYNTSVSASIYNYDGLTAYDRTLRGVVYITLTNSSYRPASTVRLNVTLTANGYLPSVRYATLVGCSGYTRSGNSIVFNNVSVGSLNPYETKTVQLGIGIEFASVANITLTPSVYVQSQY